ncbi:putative arrestin-related trafficking adapter [Fusarium oxysporum f. sp. raphani]|uniref:Putative arrestin-related trafficking adapter n=2 Tax=Fusarium oxysporum TaxID=5507 RepID=A0A8J5UDP9_FUSOX|nr:putative arrestin-related trafficking adapter [Fusarium oxysporum f. sp. raphani]
MSVQSAEFAVAPLAPRPVTSGGGVTCFILLAEHDVFLSGFDHDRDGHREGQSGTALLRGILQLSVSKNIKIKAVQLKLLGRARTDWPEGMKLGYYEEKALQTQVLTFFNAMNNEWKYDYGNQCKFRLKSRSPNDNDLVDELNPPKSLSPHYHSNNSTEEVKRLSPESIQVRSLNKGNPIATATRQWQDQLYYDIIILGKGFPVGSKIPITFQLTPLANVQVYGLKVFVIESIEYWSNDRTATRRASSRKILLFSKVAGKTLAPSWASSDLRTIRGGELTTEQRREAREVAARQRTAEASRQNIAVQPLPEPNANLLGDLDLGLENFWGPTEIEVDVQIPTCGMMARKENLKLYPECTWRNVNIRHWIKVVLPTSRLDPVDPTGTERRNFEISINLPFTLLHCRATPVNINLPTYSDEICQSTTCQSTCGCPDALNIPTESSTDYRIGTLAGVNLTSGDRSSPRRAAHLASGQQSPRSSAEIAVVHDSQRPIHLFAGPNLNPLTFDNNIAQPPPPNSSTKYSKQAS